MIASALTSKKNVEVDVEAQDQLNFNIFFHLQAEVKGPHSTYTTSHTAKQYCTRLHLTPSLSETGVLSLRTNQMPDRTNTHKKTNGHSLAPPLHLLNCRRFTPSPLKARCGQNYSSGTTADINNHRAHDDTPPPRTHLASIQPETPDNGSSTPFPIASMITVRGKTNHLESERDNVCSTNKKNLESERDNA